MSAAQAPARPADFVGEESHEKARKAKEAIQAIRNFDEGSMYLLIATILEKLEASNWSHLDVANGIRDGFSDAQGSLEHHAEQAQMEES